MDPAWKISIHHDFESLGVPFHPVVVIGLGKNLLLKSVLGHCAIIRIFFTFASCDYSHFLYISSNHFRLNNFVYLCHIPHNPTINPGNTECGHNIYLVQLIRTTNFSNQILFFYFFILFVTSNNQFTNLRIFLTKYLMIFVFC